MNPGRGKLARDGELQTSSALSLCLTDYVAACLCGRMSGWRPNVKERAVWIVAGVTNQTLDNTVVVIIFTHRALTAEYDFVIDKINESQ